MAARACQWKFHIIAWICRPPGLPDPSILCRTWLWGPFILWSVPLNSAPWPQSFQGSLKDLPVIGESAIQTEVRFPQACLTPWLPRKCGVPSAVPGSEPIQWKCDLAFPGIINKLVHSLVCPSGFVELICQRKYLFWVYLKSAVRNAPLFFITFQQLCDFITNFPLDILSVEMHFVIQSF